MSFSTFSRQLARLPYLDTFVGHRVTHLSIGQIFSVRKLSALYGWGFRPSTRLPRRLASHFGVPFINLEDGFLRSFAPGRDFPPVSLVLDRQGIYYAADRPSDLETLLASDSDILRGPGADHAIALERILAEGLSKYNHAPDIDSLPGRQSGPRILIIDQTRGDASVKYGLANAHSFSEMVAAARRDNPGSTFYIKTHPEVSSGAKSGYLSELANDERCIMLRDPISPASLLKHVDKVYTVTSHLGFEALLRGLPVHCFGLPWYAGWGCTHDALICERRTKRRTVNELFAAAYMHYTRYLDPTTGLIGSIFDAIEWLAHQRRSHHRHSGRTIAIGYRRWKAENVEPFLRFNGKAPNFVKDATAAAALKPSPADHLVVWGTDAPPPVKVLAQASGAQLLRMEDGFVRSVGLGSDFVPPSALVLDGQGLYFDPRQASDLEDMLNMREFTDEDRKRARLVREMIVANGITKYNVEPNEIPSWSDPDRYTILVPGQVEDDASVRYGSQHVQSNLQLLRAVRLAAPAAYIVYKPHPDVMANNRVGRLHRCAALEFANTIESKSSIVSCIEACDEVHTITSLSGFDALLRGKSVTTYGTPFYAGWGLTTDRVAAARRQRKLTVDDLVAGALLHYPIYFDRCLNGYTTCEATLRYLIKARQLQSGYGVHAPFRQSHWKRQWKKIAIWIRAGFTVTR
ncbi:hypothetical protein LMG26690_00600 [Achromobacter animicus]|uniref:Uncharacterized protein n=1 Tax=Achromobacter animicus TaxID=1389935 RepID=A0A6S6Z5E7_9BURK|nr:capsular polysaccharide biosynthesis protein [Achromobacter animicus]CAB3661580.1 hypothetical protein LMG26690_00600 [Achromobacter animicus]